LSRLLVAGLGNPGLKYQNTRHNIGFMVLDLLADTYHEGFRRQDARQCLEAQLTIAGKRVVLIKPQTYMNRSGFALQKSAGYYKIAPEDILVVHDDLDLDLGRIKLVRGGGAGGHNGIRSIIEQLGTKAFPRLKVGIGRPTQPIPIDRFVLSPFSSDELQVVERVLEVARDAVVHFVENGIDSAMNRFNGMEIGTL
jgi:PTH1 family peptidyl-tRNA hydrolase